MADLHKNFAISKVVGAPSPATSGTSLAITTGDGTKFPTPPFNAIVWPANTQPTTTNAEIVRVTGIATDTFTMTRTQESTSARTITVGDQIMAGITAKSLTDIEGTIYTPASITVATTASGFKADYYTTGTNDHTVIQSAITQLNSLGGGKLLLKKGTYTVAGSIQLYSNIYIEGEGAGATIVKSSGGWASGDMFYIGSTFGTSSGSDPADTYTNISLKGIEFDANSLAHSPVVLHGASNVTIRECFMHDGTNYGFYIANGTNVYVKNNKVTNLTGTGTQDCIQFKGVVNGWVVNNYCYNAIGTNTTGCIDSHATDGVNGRNGSNNHFVSNTCILGGQGINCEDDMGEIIGNIVSQCHNGISAATATAITIANNNVKNSSNIGIYASTSGVRIVNNYSYDDQGTPTQGYGVQVVASAGNLDISGNYFKNNVTAGVRFNGTNSGNKVQNNIFVGGQYAISFVTIGDNANNLLTNNYFSGQTVSKYQNSSNIGSGTTFDDGNTFSFEGGSAKTIQIGSGSSANGQTLTLKAADSNTNSANLAGGALILKSGAGTGNNSSSSIQFLTGTDTTSGTTVQTLSEKMRLFASANGRLVIGNPSGIVGTFDGLNLRGDANRWVAVTRQTSGSAARNLTVQAGGIVTGGVNGSGGTLALASGIATGTGSSQIQLQTATAAAAGVISTISIGSAGSSYTVNDVLTITGGGGTSGTATVTSVDGLGAVLAVSLTTGGSGYAVTTGAATTGGTGTGVTINILTINATDNNPTTKVTVLGSGSVGIGQTSPTALLHLKAGTATTNTAPLKLTAGVNLATPEDGAIEYDGAHYYGTVGSTRYQLDQQTIGGNVTSVTGTTNRITSTGGTTPVIDIDAAYVGQTSITTLGTITTGTWNGTAIDHTKLTGITQADIAGLTTASTPTYAGLNLGTGNLSTVGGVTLEGGSARTMSAAQSTTTTGANVTLQAGQSVTGGTNEVGGQLLLKANAGTGSDANGIVSFYTATTGTSGTTTQTVSEKARLTGATNGVLLVGATGSSNGLNTNDGIGLGGQVARSIYVLRNTTTNTAGQNLGIIAGSATTGATDKDGGNLILSPGISTGVGRAITRIQGMTTATATGTGANTSLDRMVISAFKALTNNSAIALVNATLASNTSIAGTIRYAVEVFNGTDLQVEQGAVSYMATNKGGVFSGNTALKYGNQQAVTTGTLTVTFAITGANPAVISVNANSSLTPSAGYPRVTYSVENLTQQAIAIQ